MADVSVIVKRNNVQSSPEGTDWIVMLDSLLIEVNANTRSEAEQESCRWIIRKTGKPELSGAVKEMIAWNNTKSPKN